MLKTCLVLLASVAIVYAATGSVGIIKESLVEVPEGWNRVDRAHPDHTIKMTIAVKQQPKLDLEELLLSVSDVNSLDYGQHLSFEEVNRLTSPATESIDAVYSWLIHHGISRDAITTTPNHDFIQFVTTCRVAEKLLHTEYHNFEHEETKYSVLRAQDYKLPWHVHEHIDFVGPTVRFPSSATVRRRTYKPTPHAPHNNLRSSNPNSACSGWSINPACLRELYNIDYTANAKNNSVAVTGFLEQYINLDDLESFFKGYDVKSSGRKPTIIGPNVASNPGVEANLDIQYVMAMGSDVATTFWYTSGRQPNSTVPDNEPFLDWLVSLSSTAQAPWVISTSYGDNEDTVNYDYSVRINNEFIKAGLRGISLMFSSGDGGVSGGQAGDCTTFVPTFPAGSPYVTAVGGTSGIPERAASLSSGGFSNRWGRPAWQSQAVSDYLTKYGTNLPDSSLYNGTSRGFPDVSVQATSFTIVQSGFPFPVDGTSCSSPTFGGIVSLLNDVRLAAGKSTLGFLNPFLYAHASSFNDITSGNNPGCSTDGFHASTGWDPVTGLGTPNFKKLAAAVASLP